MATGGKSGTPGPVEAMLASGLAHHRAGRLGEAAQCYERVLAAEPRHADALHLLGVVRHQRGEHASAADLIRRAIALAPRNAAFHSNLGEALRAMGDLEAAIKSYRRALALDSRHAEAHGNLGAALEAQGARDEAVRHYRRALQINPTLSEARANLGNVLMDQGRLDDAIAAYRAAVAARPDFAHAHNNLGNALKRVGALKDAEAAFARALALAPMDPLSHSNLGTVYQAQGRLDEAFQCYQRALDLTPDFAEAHANLGSAHFESGNFDAATEETERALALDPGLTRAHLNRALLHLIQGELEDGWREFEWRWKWPESRPRSFPKPLWDGGDLAGRSILIHAEQGLGATVMFLRYVPLVAARGGQVILDVQKPLRGLAARLSGVAHLVEDASRLPRFDCHLPVLSLPKVFTTALATIPAQIPYLSVDPQRVALWRQRIGDHGFRVGIAWQGNPGYGRDRDRSIPSTHYVPLAQVPGVRLISLQQQHGLEQLAAWPTGVALETLAGIDSADFTDTAAAMMSLDLVVTSDTSIAHVAGALGRPVWVALGLVPDWRWLLARDDSPWYPTMRLFRQPAHGDWGSVFTRLCAELARRVAEAHKN
jgi:tetratricopeptide (TPR) repeat protein